MKEKQNEQTEKVYCDNESSHTPHSDTKPGKKKIRKERWGGGVLGEILILLPQFLSSFALVKRIVLNLVDRRFSG